MENYDTDDFQVTLFGNCNIPSLSPSLTPVIQWLIFYNLAFKEQRFSYSAALSWIYFCIYSIVSRIDILSLRFVTYSERDS